MDAVGLLRQAGQFLREGQDGVVVFQDGLGQVGYTGAHHGAAVQYLARLGGQTAAEVQQFLNGGADQDLHVLGLFDDVPVHRQALGGQGHTGLQILGDEGHGGNVHHDHAHIGGQTGEWDLAAGAILNQHLLSALGVAAGQLLDLDAGRVDGGLHLGDGLGLVALDADDALGNVQILHHCLDAAQHMVGILKEAAVIRGDIGLTLGAVDEQCVDLVQVLGGQLHRRGEAGAAQTHQAAGPDGVLERL